jgi:hypothetical protein
MFGGVRKYDFLEKQLEKDFRKLLRGKADGKIVISKIEKITQEIRRY